MPKPATITQARMMGWSLWLLALASMVLAVVITSPRKLYGLDWASGDALRPALAILAVSAFIQVLILLADASSKKLNDLD